MKKDIICPRKNEVDEFMYLNGALLRNGLYKIGLYVGQPVILDVISKNPGLTQKTLADLGGIKPSTINVMLTRMAKNELVEIKRDEKNSKLSRVYITEKGKNLCAKALEYRENIQEKQFNNFTEAEVETFKELLNRINQNLQSILDEEENLNENN